MSGYIMDNILSDEDMKEAVEASTSAEYYEIFQYYNLFDMDRADIVDVSKFGFAKKLLDYSKNDECTGMYFLRYKKGSFTRMHHDEQSDLTIVTLISDRDLVGGHSLVTEIYEPRARPADQRCERNNGEDGHPPYGQDIIQDVLPVTVGESLVYGSDLKHGVSKVYEGERLVLVSWYKNTNKEAV